MNASAVAVIVSLMVAPAEYSPWAASELSGRVVFSGLAVPGATVTATRNQHIAATISDGEGIFRFVALDEGTWTLRVEMSGFVTVNREVVVPAAEPSLSITLTKRSHEQIAGASRPTPAAPAAAVSLHPPP